MAILSADIKFVASAVMDDVPNGGGAPTGNVIPDGQSNAVFPDISELDRAGGRVSLRKLHVAVETDDTDTYLGANVIVALPPADPGVSVTLFSTGQTFDERDDARSRIESYLIKGPQWAGFLLENHITGQRVIQIFQRTTEALVDIGRTLVLVYNEGLGTQREQYVRVISVSSTIRTYTKPNGQDYQATVMECELSDPLRYDFPGTEPNEFFKAATGKTLVRDTSVADAGVYCGVSETTEAIEIGDLSATVDTVFTQLVPSAQTEIPLADLDAAGVATAVTQAGTGDATYTTSQPFNASTVLSVGNAITPGTLSIAIGGVTLTDEGGQLFDGATAVGVIDYARGNVSFPALAAPYNGTKTVTFKPAAAPQRVAETGQIPVTISSRAYNYIVTLDPTPAPGTLQISYRANGRWYDLRDNGGGVLGGTDSAFGVGSVSYSSGTASVTLGALPDVGSALLYTWANKVEYLDRSALAVSAPSIQFATESYIKPGDLSIEWNDGTAHTVADDGEGNLTGDATGTVNYFTGVINMRRPTLGLAGQEYDVTVLLVNGDDVEEATLTNPTREVDTTVEFDLGQTNVRPGSVELEWDVEIVTPVTQASGVRNEFDISPVVRAKDDAAGNIIVEGTNRVAGTINYTTGIINFQPDGDVVGRRQSSKLVFTPIGYAAG